MRRYAALRERCHESIFLENVESSFIPQAIEEVVVDNEDQGARPGEVIEEPEFQPEINQVDDDQIGEPPQPKPNVLRFDGRL